jgi:2-dehydro-3-deoxy-D-arabinonate dehydratase
MVDCSELRNNSFAIGQEILISDAGNLRDLPIELIVQADGAVIFRDSTRTSQMDRPLDELATYLGRELDFPDGASLMTGTGIAPADDLVLRLGDKVRIRVGELTLENEVALPEPEARLSGRSSPFEGQRYRTIR